MLSPNIRAKLARALVLPLLALSTSCGGVGPGSPPEFRLQPVAYPEIPEASTPCRHDPNRMCNTDEETAGVLAGYDAALGEANLRLCWLAHYFAQEPEGCRVE